MTWVRNIVILLVILGIGGCGAYWYINKAKGDPVIYKTAAVNRGDLLATISATGTVEPEEVVDVGAQVAGQINTFGKDKDGKTIDYGSVVEADMVLAQIDDSLYASDVALATAQLEQAKAGVIRATADLEQMKAKLNQAQRDWDRAQKLGPSEALAQTQFDAYQSAFEVAKANVAVGESTIALDKAAVDQAQATLARAQRNLGYCTIKAPVKGVIIDRRVNIGQTVVSSLSAPSLFLLAKDLKRMQVWVSVNEADVGSIYPGQPVSFTADAYPGRTFKGEVGKVRLNAQMTQNVVTFTVEVITDNSDGKLLPYLTANVQFELSRRQGVLVVPNSALRWYPATPEQVVPEARDALAAKGGRGGGGGKPSADEGKAAGAKEGQEASPEKGKQAPREEGKDTPAEKGGEAAGEKGKNLPAEKGGDATPEKGKAKAKRPAGEGKRTTAGMLWVIQNEFVRPIKVRVGLSDGTNTEVSGDDVKEGMEVVVGEQQTQTTAAAANPFVPQFRQKGK
jgi:HlyD family secretion protein